MANKRAACSNLARPGGMCEARGRDREGEIRDLGLDFEDEHFGLIDIGQYLTKPS